MKQINVGVIGPGWCGGIRANACAINPLVNELHLAEIDVERLAVVAGETQGRVKTNVGGVEAAAHPALDVGAQFGICRSVTSVVAMPEMSEPGMDGSRSVRRVSASSLPSPVMRSSRRLARLGRGAVMVTRRVPS